MRVVLTFGWLIDTVWMMFRVTPILANYRHVDDIIPDEIHARTIAGGAHDAPVFLTEGKSRLSLLEMGRHSATQVLRNA